MSFLRKSIYAVILLISFVSCDNQEEDQSDLSSTDLSTKLTASSLTQLGSTRWMFTNYVKNKIDSEFENKITLVFDDSINEKLSYSGESLVNSYIGAFTVGEGTGLILEVQDGISTLAGTEDEKMAAAEQGYYTNLEKATYFEIENGKLKLYLGDTSKQETEIMVFSRN